MSEKGEKGEKVEEVEEVDTSLWVPSIDGTTPRFALPLVQYLIEQDLLKTWVSCNRPCFALSNICKVPSARKALITALKPYKKEIEASAVLFAGGKVLFEELAKN